VTKKKIDLSPERKLITQLIVSTEFCKEIMPTFKPHLMATPYGREVGRWCKSHYDLNGEAPGADYIGTIYANKRPEVENRKDDEVGVFLLNLSKDHEKSGPVDLPVEISKAKEYLTTRNHEIQTNPPKYTGTPPTDYGDAERISSVIKYETRYCVDFAKWFHFDGKRWIEDHGLQIFKKIVQENRKIYLEAFKEEDDDLRQKIVKHGLLLEQHAKIKSLVELSRGLLAITPDNFDTEPWELNCQNGILDLKTGELNSHNPEKYMTKISNADYKSNAKCPLFKKFLKEIFNDDKELTSYIQGIAGMALVGEQLEQSVFIFHGMGSNGKSVLLNILAYVLGDYSMQCPVETIMMKKNDSIPNDLARLRGARLVSTTESPEGRSLNEARIKAMVGGDVMTARFLHAEYFEFKPVFTLLLATNHKPIIKGTDHAIWRRIKLIPFAVTIPDEQQDHDLLNKLKEEANGILAWAVRGLQRYLANGLSVPEQVQAAIQEYRSDMDLLGDFIASCCMEKGRCGFKELYKTYSSYCEKEKEPSMGKIRFSSMLQERNYTKYRGSKNIVSFRGISLKDEE